MTQAQMTNPFDSLRGPFTQMVDWVTTVAEKARTFPVQLALNVSLANASSYDEAADHDAEWQKHFQTNRTRILQMVARSKTIWADRFLQPDITQHPRAMILGAGACRDIPLREILDAGFQVTLVDIDRAPMERARAALPHSDRGHVAIEVRDASGGYFAELLSKTATVTTASNATLYEKWCSVMDIMASTTVPTPNLTNDQPVDFLISSMLVYPMAQFAAHTMQEDLAPYANETEQEHLRNFAAAHHFFWETLLGKEKDDVMSSLVVSLVYVSYMVLVAGSHDEGGWTFLDQATGQAFAGIKNRFFGKVLAAHNRGIANFLAHNPHAMVYYASDVAQQLPVITEDDRRFIGSSCPVTPMTTNAATSALIFTDTAGIGIPGLQTFGLEFGTNHMIKASRWVWGNEFVGEDFASEGCGFITPQRHCLMPKWNGGDIVCRTVEALEITPKDSL